MKSYTVRHGFTIIETVVVVAVIAILSALLLIGVQAARERARLLQCQARVAQLALASQNHLATHRHFPSNGWGFRWIGIPERGAGPDQPGGWIFQLLPALEISPSSVVSNPESHPVMDDFRCPSRPSRSLGPQSNLFVPVGFGFSGNVARTDYAICEGDFITNTDGGPASLSEGDNSSYRWTDTSQATGVSFLRSTVRPKDVTDGLSQTFVLGEKHVSKRHYDDGLDLGYDQSLFSGVDLDLNRWSWDIPVPDGEHSRDRQFGSAHAAGVVMAYCDGRVQLVSYQVTRKVFRQSGHRADNGRF